LTRLPTTVAQLSSTGAPALRPFAVTSTFVPTGPLVMLRFEAAEASVVARSSGIIVVRDEPVAATSAGQSIRGAGRPLSFVTVKPSL
jgi:hypothetical protein